MRLVWLGLCAVLSLATSGCGPCGVPTSVANAAFAKPEAEKLAQTYFDHFRAKEYVACLPLYSAEFWKETPQETWLRILPNVAAELGPLKTCKLTRWRAGQHAATSGTGTSVELTYACKHEKYDSIVSLRVFTPLGGKPEIIAHSFNSIGFLIE